MTLEKIITGILMVPAVVLIHATIGGLFVYWGWNHSHALLGVREIGYTEAFWLCMLVRSLVPNIVTYETSK